MSEVLELLDDVIDLSIDGVVGGLETLLVKSLTGGGKFLKSEGNCGKTTKNPENRTQFKQELKPCQMNAMTQTDFETTELQQKSFKNKLIEQSADDTTAFSHGAGDANQIPAPPPIPIFHPSESRKSISHGFLG